jgi:DNA polymerase III epsilon subunit-like protein
MKLYALFHGEWIEKYLSYKCYKLKRAALDCGIKIPPNLHRARVDAELTRQVVMYMASAKDSTIPTRIPKGAAAPLYL